VKERPLGRGETGGLGRNLFGGRGVFNMGPNFFKGKEGGILRNTGIWRNQFGRSLGERKGCGIYFPF